MSNQCRANHKHTFLQSKARSKIEEKLNQLFIVCLMHHLQHSVNLYNTDYQQQFKTILISNQPSCAFAHILTGTALLTLATPAHILTGTALLTLATPVGAVPKGSILSYQTLELEQPDLVSKSLSQDLPPLPLGLIVNSPCVYKIADE